MRKPVSVLILHVSITSNRRKNKVMKKKYFHGGGFSRIENSLEAC